MENCNCTAWLVCFLPVWLRNSHLGMVAALQIAMTSLCVDMAENIPFHTTCEMAVRKWNSHISLPKACHFRRYLQELNDLLLFFLTSPHLWSIKELGIQTWQDGYFETLVCHLLSQLALWIKSYSLPQYLVSQIY